MHALKFLEIEQQKSTASFLNIYKKLCESRVEKTDKQEELVEFSCDEKPTDSTLFTYLPNLR